MGGNWNIRGKGQDSKAWSGNGGATGGTDKAEKEDALCPQMPSRKKGRGTSGSWEGEGRGIGKNTLEFHIRSRVQGREDSDDHLTIMDGIKGDGSHNDRSIKYGRRTRGEGLVTMMTIVPAKSWAFRLSARKGSLSDEEQWGH